jgi:hypothetical protein
MPKVYYYSQDYAGYISKTILLYSQNYKGDVSKTVQQYSQTYTGEVVAEKPYYSYYVTIEYEGGGFEKAEVLHVCGFISRFGSPLSGNDFYAGEAFHLRATVYGTPDEVRVLSPFDVGPREVRLENTKESVYEEILYDVEYKALAPGEYTFIFEAVYGESVFTEEVTIRIVGHVDQSIRQTL